jgi:hypothetical protein
VSPEAEEAARLAANIARNTGWPVFPCRGEDKRPCTPHGFKDATIAPDEIAALWRRYPGPLIGLATGTVSGIDVFDLDVKDPAALAFWHDNADRLPSTRAFRTRSGGGHFYFQHRPNTRNRQGDGLDVRGDGGFIIFWFAAGLECLDHSPIAPWPDWLHWHLFPPPKPLPSRPASRPAGNINAAFQGLLRRVDRAADGERNGVTYWAACRAREMVQAGQIGQREAARLLVDAAVHAGLSKIESERTVRSGLGGGAHGR